jgi:hypothetical protein
MMTWVRDAGWTKFHETRDDERTVCGQYINTRFIVERDEDGVPPEDKCKRCLKKIKGGGQ